ncbi:hypothetical protein AB1Y20_005400 [Prymnesium parvum]|uniref:Uncharacterized protein n=1 Tax=Prymnesium parvum TaxID=97485 RepID=A0AB34J468_PRYPA
MKAPLLLLACCCAHALALVSAASEAAANKEDTQPLTAAERKHIRSQSPFAIGEGFEGSASDWTEYVVWVLGVVGVFYYWMHPSARRIHEADMPHVNEAVKEE